MDRVEPPAYRDAFRDAPLSWDRIEHLGLWPLEDGHGVGFARLQVPCQQGDSVPREAPTAVAPHASRAVYQEEKGTGKRAEGLTEYGIGGVHAEAEVPVTRYLVEVLTHGGSLGLEANAEVLVQGFGRGVDVRLGHAVAGAEDLESRVTRNLHRAEGCTRLHPHVHAQVVDAVSRIDRKPVSVGVEAVHLGQRHLQGRDGRSGLLGRNRDCDPVDVSVRVELDEGGILFSRQCLQESAEGFGAVLRGRLVYDVPYLQPKIGNQLVPLFEREEDLPFLEYPARVVELLDDHDPGVPLRQLNLHMGPVDLGRQRRGRLPNFTERSCV